MFVFNTENGKVVTSYPCAGVNDDVTFDKSGSACTSRAMVRRVYFNNATPITTITSQMFRLVIARRHRFCARAESPVHKSSGRRQAGRTCRIADFSGAPLILLLFVGRSRLPPLSEYSNSDGPNLAHASLSVSVKVEIGQLSVTPYKDSVETERNSERQPDARALATSRTSRRLDLLIQRLYYITRPVRFWLLVAANGKVLIIGGQPDGAQPRSSSIHQAALAKMSA